MAKTSQKPPAEHIEWAKYLRAKIPGDAVKVVRNYDEGEQNAIDIFTTENRDGVVAATLGLMQYDQSKTTTPLYTEILMDAKGRINSLSNVISTIAFFMMKDRWKVSPGATFADMVKMYLPDLHVQHVLFVPPFQWPDGMTKVALSTRTIYPLLAIPITDGELQLVQQNGADELQDRWEKSATDVLDWTREGIA